MKDLEVRFFLKKPFKGNRMVYVSMTDKNSDNLENFQAVLEGEVVNLPMLFTGHRDINGNKLFDNDYVQFYTEGKSRIIGLIKYINERNKNGFIIISMKNKLNSWTLNEYFIETMKPIKMGNKWENNLNC